MSKTVPQKSRTRKKSSTNSGYWIIGGVAVAAILVLALVVVNMNAPRSGVTPPSQVNSGRILGNADAPVTIDLYSDFQCPICRRADLMIRELAPQYIDTGKAKIVYHNFAFIGTESVQAAQAAECANDQHKFWEYASYLFDNQTGENVGAFSNDNLKRFASELKLDTSAFNACLDTGKHAGLIQQELAEGRNRGINATPSFYINGQFVEGLLPVQQFTAMIDAYLPKP